MTRPRNQQEGRSAGPGVPGLLAWGLALNCLFASTAHAYIDPGTGSMLLQVIGALVAGAIFYFRESLLRVKGLFLRRPKVTNAPSPPEPGDDAAP
jgi:hypothetical protein